jgi:Pyridoxal-dependent decarboxylase conserved domain
VEKAGLIGLVKLRLVNSDVHLSLRGEAFRTAVEADVADGLIPFFVSNLSCPCQIDFFRVTHNYFLPINGLLD